MPTVLSYLTTRRDAAKAALATVRADLDAARDKEAPALAAHAAAGTAAADLGARVEAARRALAESSGRTEGGDLVAELDGLLAEHSAAVVALAGADFARRSASAEVRRQGALAERAAARLADDEARLAKAAETDRVRAAQVALLAAAPLHTLRADAGTALATDYPPASTRVDEIPEELRAHVLVRRQRAADVRKAFADAVAKAAAAVSAEFVVAKKPDRPEVIARARAAVRRADAARERYVLLSPGELASAVGVLAAIADVNLDRITPEEKARIAAIPTTPDGVAALAARKALIDAVKAAEVKLAEEEAKPDSPAKDAAVAAAKYALRKAIDALVALSADADVLAGFREARKVRDAKHLLWAEARRTAGEAGSPNPDIETAVVTARGILDTAIDDLRKAHAKFKATPAGVFRDWELAVPDAAWRRFHALHDAHATLTRLATTDTAALGTAIDTADDDLAKLLKDADDRAAAVAALDAAVAAAEDRAAADADAHGGRMSV